VDYCCDDSKHHLAWSRGIYCIIFALINIETIADNMVFAVPVQIDNFSQCFSRRTGNFGTSDSLAENWIEFCWFSAEPYALKVEITAVGLVDSNFSLWTCPQRSSSGMCNALSLDLNKCNDVPDNFPIPALNQEFLWPPQQGGFQITFKTPHLVAGCTYVVTPCPSYRLSLFY